MSKNTMIKNKMRDLHDKEEGFTLVELLIVIVILGVLSAVVVFSVNGITNRGEVASCRAELKTVQVAVESFRAQGTGYPANLSALTGFLQDPPADNTYSVGSGTITYTPGTGKVTGTC